MNFCIARCWAPAILSLSQVLTLPNAQCCGGRHFHEDRFRISNYEPTATRTVEMVAAACSGVLIFGSPKVIGRSLRGGRMRSRQSRRAAISPPLASSIAFGVRASPSTKTQRHGYRTVDLPHHRRRTRRTVVGERKRATGCSVSVRAAAN